MEEDRALEDKVESPLSISTAAPPFDVDLAIPADSAGAMRVVAVAEVAERRASYVLFDEVSFRVVPEAPLVALRVESPVRFSGSLGEVKLFNVQGLYGDRVVRDIGSATAGTTYYLVVDGYGHSREGLSASLRQRDSGDRREKRDEGGQHPGSC